MAHRFPVLIRHLFLVKDEDIMLKIRKYFLIVLSAIWNALFSDGTVNKCTGWLCGASTVMTVAHNVYRPERGWVKSIKVWPGEK